MLASNLISKVIPGPILGFLEKKIIFYKVYISDKIIS